MMQLQSFLVSLCLFTLATATLADVIPVRSGAHDGFSRLVLHVPPGTQWSLENQPGLAKITISDHVDGFDISNVFNRIDQTHIATVASRANVLEVHLSCGCRAKAFQQGNRMIVIDFSDAIIQENGSGVQDERQISAANAELIGRFGTAVQRPSALPKSMPVTLHDLPVFRRKIAEGPLVRRNEPEANSLQLNEVQTSLATQFGAAATRGLLKPRVSGPKLPLPDPKPHIDLSVFDPPPRAPRENELTDLSLSGNIRVTSSADRSDVLNSPIGSTSTDFNCKEADGTNIRDWGTKQPFSVQIAKLRSDLYTEFDRLNHQAALRLAQTYLHFGFGMEARQMLRLDPKLRRTNSALIEMAEILEFGHVKQPKYLHNFVECDTDIALWAILSKTSIEPEAIVNTEAALRAVSALPMQLRIFLAPALSRRLLNHGEADAAATALRSVERTALPLSASGSLAKANLEIAAGEVKQAQDRLAQVVTSNVEQSAAALVQFIDSHLDADAQIDESVAILVEGYALQMRDEPIGAELRRAHVLALGKSGQFDEAFDALDRIRERDAATLDHDLASSILALLTQNGSDIAFLDHVFQKMQTPLGFIDPMAAVKMADRLVSLGFAQEAELLIASRDDIPVRDSTRILRARIALALHRPFEAEAAIFDLDSTEANSLRAQAKVQTGLYADASDFFEKSGAKDNSRIAAWLADDWSDLIDDQTTVFGEIAQVAKMKLSESTEIEGMLARTNAAIEESAAARATIRELLNTRTTRNSPIQ